MLSSVFWLRGKNGGTVTFLFIGNWVQNLSVQRIKWGSLFFFFLLLFCLRLQTSFNWHFNSKIYFFNLLSRSNPGVVQALQKSLLPYSSMWTPFHSHRHIHTFPYNTQKKPWSTEYWNVCNVLQLPLTVERIIYVLHVLNEKFNPNILKCLIQPINTEQAREGRRDFLCKPERCLTKTQPELNYLLKC